MYIQPCVHLQDTAPITEGKRADSAVCRVRQSRMLGETCGSSAIIYRHGLMNRLAVMLEVMENATLPGPTSDPVGRVPSCANPPPRPPPPPPTLLLLSKAVFNSSTQFILVL